VTITLDLPMPPSINALWRAGKGRVRRSLPYTQWIKRADAHCMAGRTFHRHHAIAGPFKATILFRQGARGDLDNRAKAVLDWAQSRELVTDDKNCQTLILEWVSPDFAPDGCRLILTECAP
jgi:Holliday junction resolvase RusA-like endonuclease